MPNKSEYPQLIEAVCQLVFPSPEVGGPPWDPSVPDRVYERIRGEFPNRSAAHKPEIAVPLVQRDKVIGNLVGPDIEQFKREEPPSMVQIGRNILVINQLEPYSGWSDFKDLIIQMYRLFGELAHPGNPFNGGIRHIYTLGEAGPYFMIGEYLKEMPPFDLAGTHILLSFYQRYEISIEDPTGMLLHTSGLYTTNGSRSVILDLDFTSDVVQDLAWGREDVFATWLDAVNDRLIEACAASLNPERSQ